MHKEHEELEIRIKVVATDRGFFLEGSALGSMSPPRLMVVMPKIEEKYHEIMSGIGKNLLKHIIFHPIEGKKVNQLLEALESNDEERVKDLVKELMGCDGNCDKCHLHGEGNSCVKISPPDPEKMKKFQEENR